MEFVSTIFSSHAVETKGPRSQVGPRGRPGQTLDQSSWETLSTMGSLIHGHFWAISRMITKVVHRESTNRI